MQLQAFIDVPCTTTHGQQAFFFKDEKYGQSLHFASKPEGQICESHEWHSLQLKRDFREYLEKHGRLPVDNLVDKTRIQQELEEYKSLEDKLFHGQH